VTASGAGRRLGNPQGTKAGVATGKTGKIAIPQGPKASPWAAIRTSGIFKVGHYPMWGLMAQVEQTRLYFKIQGAASDTENDTDDVYLDMAAALTAVNRKQYHQVKSNGDPLCYTISVTQIATSKPFGVHTAPNTWTTRNAAKKTAVGWKAQMKHAGIKLRDLPTYARRFRCALEADAVNALPNQQFLALHLCPDGADGTILFDPYISPDGGSVNYDNANDIVLLPISEDDPDEAYKACLLGATDAAGTTFGMVHEFLLSRRNMREETDMTTEFPSSVGLMNTLFAVSEELADDVVAAVDAYSITRPYSESNAIEAVYAAQVPVSTASGSVVTQTFQAPLGLLKFRPYDGEWTADDEFIIDVHAIYEM